MSYYLKINDYLIKNLQLIQKQIQRNYQYEKEVICS